MPALKPASITAQITWLGTVADSKADLSAVGTEVLHAGFDGVEGVCHNGIIRPSCTRTSAQHPVGTPIRNVRQLSVLSQEELDQIANDMGLDALNPAWLGATLVLKGIEDFSHIPPSSRLQGPSGATLVVDMENRPCIFPAKTIEKNRPGFGKAFKTAAMGRRGVTAWVEREGQLKVGDTLKLHIPDQPVWSQLDAVRGA